MENRFGFKDLLVVVLLVAIIASFWFEVIQRDREWKNLMDLTSGMSSQTEQINRIKNQMDRDIISELESISTRIAEQSEQLAKLNEQLERGVALAPSNGVSPTGTNDATQNDPAVQAANALAFPHIAAARAKPDFSEGDWYIWPLPAPVKNLTPHVSGDVYQMWIEALVMESLASYNYETQEWEPVIAESWTIAEDGLTFTFKLRKGVRFSDGSPLTANDLVFTYNWVMNPRVNAPRTRAYWEKIKSVRAIDDYTVIFEMRDSYFRGFVTCASIAILSEKYYSQFTPDQFNEKPGLLFGSGPWKLQTDPKNWVPGSGTITLVRNPHYWGLRPGLDRILLPEITDDTAMVTAFRNGEVDVLVATPPQYETLRNDPAIRERADMHIYDAVNSGYAYIGWNQRRQGEPTLFTDKRVRQAMAHLIDTQYICDRIRKGLATPVSGPFNPQSEQDDPNLKPRKYDVAKGKALLKEAGFEDRNGDGVIENVDGRPFRFELIYSAANPTTRDMVFFIKDSLARAGIIVEPNPLDWTVVQQRLDDRNFDAMTLGWGAGWIESDVYQMFHSSQIEDGADNYVHYNSPRLDALVEEARITVDPAKRMELWREVHRTLYDDQPYTFLYAPRSVVFLDKRFKNVRVLPTGIRETIPEWYVPAKLQKY